MELKKSQQFIYNLKSKWNKLWSEADQTDKIVVDNEWNLQVSVQKCAQVQNSASVFP